MRDGFVGGSYWSQSVFYFKFDALVVIIRDRWEDTVGEQTISFLSRERYFKRISWSNLDNGEVNNFENVFAKVSGE